MAKGKDRSKTHKGQKRKDADAAAAVALKQRPPESDRPAAPGEAETAAPARMTRKQYEQELAPLQGELVKLQEWVKASGAKICVLFEGRDAAGKGG